MYEPRLGPKPKTNKKTNYKKNNKTMTKSPVLNYYLMMLNIAFNF